MSEDSPEFKRSPRRKRKSDTPEPKPRKRTVVGAATPSVPRRTPRKRVVAPEADAAPVPRKRAAVAPEVDAAPIPRRARKRSAAKKSNVLSWFKYLAFAALVGIGVYAILILQPPPPAPPSDITPDPDATLVPTDVPFFPIITFPQLPTAAPTLKPTPVIPDVAIVAGHWANASNDSAPTVHDSGATCPDGLREVDITKSVADKTLDLLQKRGYHTVLLEEFDARYKTVNPDFNPRAFLSIHSDSCLMGADYSFATGYKIAHAEPSDNETEDSRLVTCLTRGYDRVAAKYDKPFNVNTITRAMTEYHAFRKIDPKTPAAIIELGFLGYDRDFLVNHQDEMAQGLAKGIDDFLQGSTCLPPTPKPAQTPTP